MHVEYSLKLNILTYQLGLFNQFLNEKIINNNCDIKAVLMSQLENLTVCHSCFNLYVTFMTILFFLFKDTFGLILWFH